MAKELNDVRPNSAITFQLDFSKATSSDAVNMIDTVVESFGQLDLLVNNASIFDKTNMEDTAEFEQSLRDNFHINVEMPAILSQACVSHLKKSQNGCIVNMCDVHGVRPLESFAAYSVSKSALIALTQSFAKEVGKHKIRVNGVSPGAIFSPPGPSDSSKNEAIIGRNSLKQFGSVQNILNALHFLINSDFVTGHIINVDGGRTLSQ